MYALTFLQEILKVILNFLCLMRKPAPYVIQLADVDQMVES